MLSDRRGGILLHPTSLPGAFGSGDLGPSAFRFVDWLVAAGCRVWELLPLNPPGFGNSPYACLSAFAGNPMLISPEQLVDDQLLTSDEVWSNTLPNGKRVDFEGSGTLRRALLDLAFARFQQLDSASPLSKEFGQYFAREHSWLSVWCAYRTLKTQHGGKHWNNWESATKLAPAQVLEQYPTEFQQAAFEQFLFDRQMIALKRYANSHDILLVGDMPLFVADDSADAWGHRELFMYDATGLSPTMVAGVPPDYFSATGQLWGNPQYDWAKHQSDQFAWWVARIRRVLVHTDICRIDHFRGLAASFHIPYGSKDATRGKWVPSPGTAMLKAVQAALGNIPLIAEDLGFITEDVTELRDMFDLPGMKILQFAFQTDSHVPFLPHNYPANCVAFTGTHDNNTTHGWYQNEASEREKDFARRYLSVSGEFIAWDMIRAIYRSSAMFAIAPLQDVLSLGEENRMNVPGCESGNWGWRYSEGDISAGCTAGMRELAELYGRMEAPPSPVVTYDSPTR